MAEGFLKLIQFYLVHPVSTAVVERGFSLMNLIKSDIRSLIHYDLLDSSLAIKYNGLDPKTIPTDSPMFLEAEEVWRGKKNRKFCS